MIEQPINGLLFFRGGRELYPCVAYKLTQTGARIRVDELGLLPTDFYVTFVKFRMIARCRLLWRYHDQIGVAFEKWIQIRGTSLNSTDV